MKLGVGGHEGESFDLGLGDQNAVERVAVVKGQCMQMQAMRGENRKYLHAGLLQMGLKEQVRSGRQFQFAQADFYADLAETDGADDKKIFLVTQQGLLSRRKSFGFVEHPKKDVGVEEDVHWRFFFLACFPSGKIGPL